jgi:hypothetical protein
MRLTAIAALPMALAGVHTATTPASSVVNAIKHVAALEQGYLSDGSYSTSLQRLSYGHYRVPAGISLRVTISGAKSFPTLCVEGWMSNGQHDILNTAQSLTAVSPGHCTAHTSRPVVPALEVEQSVRDVAVWEEVCFTDHTSYTQSRMRLREEGWEPAPGVNFKIRFIGHGPWRRYCIEAWSGHAPHIKYDSTNGGIRPGSGHC